MDRISFKGEKCEQCDNVFENCTCDFDFIVNLPEFIAKRAQAIHKRRENQIYVIKRITLLLNYVIENLPMAYTTRSGCKVEERILQAHSKHDTSRIIGTLLITEFNELLVNLSSGSHDSALRTMRSMIEWLTKAVAAVSNRSILCKISKDQNRNRAICFEGLRELIIVNKLQKSHSKEKKQISKSLKKFIQATPELTDSMRYRLFRADAKIPDGIGSIPKELNDKIMTNFKIQNPATKEIKNGSEALYSIYEILSQSVHYDLAKIEEIHYGGAVDFIDLEQFDKTYSIVIAAADAILYLYFILIDIDILHFDKETRKEGREFLKQTFYNSKFGKQTFYACDRLLKSQQWNDHNTEFVDPRK